MIRSDAVGGAGPRVHRSLMPREHGAYAQLFLPMLVPLLAGVPSFAGISLSIAFGATFLAHEPLLILLGQRGARILRECRGRAKLRFLLLASIAGVLGLLGIGFSSSTVRALTLIPVALAAVVVALLVKNQEKTFGGELAVALALSGASVPLAVEFQVPLRVAFATWFAWVLTFATATIAVRAVVRQQDSPKSLRVRALPMVGLCTLGAFAGIVETSSRVWVSPAPVVLVSMAITTWPPHPKKLKKVGWLLVVASLATTAHMILEAKNAASVG